MKLIIEQFKRCYGDFLALDLDDLSVLYAETVSFVDPIHRLEGLSDMCAYFEHSRQGLNYCYFDFDADLLDTHSKHAALQWVMRFSHPRLAKGREQCLPGVSWLTIEDKIVMHRDYYDLGDMLYEPIPVLGWVVKAIKARLGAYK